MVCVETRPLDGRHLQRLQTRCLLPLFGLLLQSMALLGRQPLRLRLARSLFALLASPLAGLRGGKLGLLLGFDTLLFEGHQLG